MEGGQEACWITRAPGQIAELHSATFVAHVDNRGPGCPKSSLRNSQCPTSVNSLAASRYCAPILRRVYPRANPTPEHHTETMALTMNNDLSIATNVRIKNAGYVMMHVIVRIAIREKLGLSNPRNSGFDRGSSNLGSLSLG